MPRFTFQAQQEPSGPFRHKVVYMANSKEPNKQFRILPALGPAVNGQVDPMSWIPFEDQNGDSTPWLLMYNIWSNIGHGPWGRTGNRKSFIDFSSLFPGTGLFDPVQRVVDKAREFGDEWRYLFDKTSQGGREDSILRRFPSLEMLANVVILTATGLPKTTVGGFSAALTRQLCGGYAAGGEAEPGILNQLSNLPKEYTDRNPYLKYWLGDVTDPNDGVVLEIYRDESRNPAPYRIRPARDGNNGMLKRAVTAEQMMARVNFADPRNMIDPPSMQEEIDRLATCLNGWSPNKHHEYELLKLAFEDEGFKVPNPPARGSVNGFVPPVSTETTTTQTQRVTYPPIQQPQPQPPQTPFVQYPAQPPQQPAPQQNVTVYPTGYGTPEQKGPVVQTTEATWPAPTLTTSAQPNPTTFNKIVGAVPPSEPSKAPEKAPSAPVANIPGQPVAPFDEATFMAQLAKKA